MLTEFASFENVSEYSCGLGYIENNLNTTQRLSFLLVKLESFWSWFSSSFSSLPQICKHICAYAACIAKHSHICMNTHLAHMTHMSDISHTDCSNQ